MLDKGLFDEYEKCLQDEPAATTARCPVHVDVPELCTQLAAGNFKEAFDVLQKRVPFAGVICLVCDAPCEQACVRKDLDTPVRISALERAAIRYGRSPYKKKFKTSKLKGKVAVVGGGISGLAAAFDLDRRGFAVSLFERTERLGGWLWKLEGKGLEQDDISMAMEAINELALEVHYDQSIDTLGLQRLQDQYDAVFLGTGTWTEALSPDPDTFRVGASSLCAGGSLAGTGDSVIEAVSSGKRAAVTMERIIKKVSLTGERDREAAFVTRLPKSLDYVEADAGEAPSDAYYTREEAQREAARCLRCACDECIKACAHLQRYGRKPKTYAREIYTNENVFLGTRYANKMINSCALCGLCGERCPLDICMAPLVAQTRRSMVENQKMPPSAHDFALRDMAFSQSEQSYLVQQPPENGPTEKAPWMFFPGCQLAGSEPEHVKAAYGWIRDVMPESVGLFLGCCGAPADWAGRDDLLKDTTENIRKVWHNEGKPTFILACSSCKDVFARYLPEVPTVSLWQTLAEQGLPSTTVRSTGTRINLHDACSTRHDNTLQQSVRDVIDDLGYHIDELRYSGPNTKCCGYGGLVFYAHREQEGDFAVNRAKESPYDLVVYCAMCKDLFVDAGKRSFHLLDLIFAKDPEEYAHRRMPSLSARQKNRAELKRTILAEVWGQNPAPPPSTIPGYTIKISPEVLTIMDQRFILESDISDALARAIADPEERFYNTDDDCYLISLRKQYVTYWVRYRQEGNTLEVLSAYSHRMSIVEPPK